MEITIIIKETGTPIKNLTIGDTFTSAVGGIEQVHGCTWHVVGHVMTPFGKLDKVSAVLTSANGVILDWEYFEPDMEVK